MESKNTHTNLLVDEDDDSDRKMVKESESSPLRHNPLPLPTSPPEKPNSMAIVAVDEPLWYSPARSPPPLSPPLPPPDRVARPLSPHVVVVNRSIKEELAEAVKMDGDGVEDGGRRIVGRADGGVEGGVEEGRGENGGGGRKVKGSGYRRESKEGGIVDKAALSFRVLEVVFCLVSLSVMAADKTQGWAGDSFDRFCISTNIIGFVYSGFQALDLAYYLVTEKHVISHHLRCLFDFVIDQVLTYLLISASSASASRVDSWVTNWGKDEFTKMISASIAMSFLAFASFGFSSLISGYHLCTHTYT